MSLEDDMKRHAAVVEAILIRMKALPAPHACSNGDMCYQCGRSDLPLGESCRQFICVHCFNNPEAARPCTCPGIED